MREIIRAYLYPKMEELFNRTKENHKQLMTTVYPIDGPKSLRDIVYIVNGWDRRLMAEEALTKELNKQPSKIYLKVFEASLDFYIPVAYLYYKSNIEIDTPKLIDGLIFRVEGNYKHIKEEKPNWLDELATEKQRFFIKELLNNSEYELTTAIEQTTKGQAHLIINFMKRKTDMPDCLKKI